MAMSGERGEPRVRCFQGRKENNVTPSENADNHYYADAPIKSSSEDLLGRSKFAKAVARAIAEWSGGESLVIAISGEWGSGKSSAKNLILELVGASAQTLQFNPWQWAGQDLLSEAFFDEISITLGRADASRVGKKRALKFRYYGKILQTAGYAAKGANKLIPFAIIAITALGYTFSRILIGSTAQLITVGGWVLLVSAILYWGGDFAEKLADVFDARGQLRTQTLDEKKESLKKSLAGLKKPILVILDDIDRLTSSEVRYLLQLVKANTNFPKLVFLLLYDRRVVEKFLEAEGFPGAEYLRKIVQVPFDIPSVSKSKIHEILFSKLDPIIERVGAPKFDEIRWGNLFYGALNEYFEDLRSVYRFSATLNFHAGLFVGRAAFEVNPVDLIGIEVLRVFEPGVYSRLHAAKSSLAGVTGTTSKKGEKERVDEIIDQASPEKRDRVKAILRALFPRLEAIYSNTIYDASSAEAWLRDVRICSAEKFDRYFQLSLSEDDLSESDLKELLESTSDRQKFLSKMNELAGNGLLPVTLDRLDSYKQEISINNYLGFVTGLLDITDDLPEPKGPAFLGPFVRAYRILYWYLLQDVDPLSRGRRLESCFDQSVGMDLIARLLSGDLERKAKGGTSTLLIDEDSRARLIEKWLTRVREISKDPAALLKIGTSAQLLFRWEEWGEADEVSAWALGNLTSPDLVLRLVTKLTSKGSSQAIGDSVSRVTWNISIESVEKFLPAEFVEDQLSKLSSATLSEKEKFSVRAFSRELQRRRAGKKGDSFFDDEDEE